MGVQMLLIPLCEQVVADIGEGAALGTCIVGALGSGIPGERNTGAGMWGRSRACLSR